MESKQEKLTRVASCLVGKKVTIEDSSGWSQASHERVDMAEVVGEKGIVFSFGNQSVEYIIGRGQHISCINE